MEDICANCEGTEQCTECQGAGSDDDEICANCEGSCVCPWC